MLSPWRLQCWQLLLFRVGPWTSSASSLAVHPPLRFPRRLAALLRTDREVTAQQQKAFLSVTLPAAAVQREENPASGEVRGCRAGCNPCVFRKNTAGIAKVRTLKQGAGQSCSRHYRLGNLTNICVTKRTVGERPAPVLGVLLFSASLMCWTLG